MFREIKWYYKLENFIFKSMVVLKKRRNRFKISGKFVKANNIVLVVGQEPFFFCFIFNTIGKLR